MQFSYVVTPECRFFSPCHFVVKVDREKTYFSEAENVEDVGKQLRKELAFLSTGFLHNFLGEA